MHRSHIEYASEAGSYKNELRRNSKFELSWVVQLLKHFYILRKRVCWFTYLCTYVRLSLESV
jgi:hypothetical protein